MGMGKRYQSINQSIFISGVSP